MMKRGLALILCLCALLSLAGAGAEGNPDLLYDFVLHHGDRNSPKIAITVDDCYKSATEWIEKDVALCREYGVAMTFFPLVYTGCLEEQYRELWQSVVDAGCEIGTHTNRHVKLGNRDTWGIIGGLGRAQEALDQTLGYHYEIRWLRPPYGSIADGKKLKKQNGSILLFHSKKKDSNFLEKLIPELKVRGFEMVTVSELFGFPPPETGGELYVYDKENYRTKD